MEAWSGDAVEYWGRSGRGGICQWEVEVGEEGDSGGEDDSSAEEAEVETPEVSAPEETMS